MADNLGGRPETPKEILEVYLGKLEPFLKNGEKLYRACLNAQVPYANVYDHYQKHDWFSERIDAFSAYPANIVNNLLFGRVIGIATKQSKMQELLNDLKNGKIKKEDFPTLKAEYEISEDDWTYIKWYATNAHTVRDDFGTRAELTGKDGAPLVPSTSSKDVAILLQAILNKPDDNTSQPISTDTPKSGEDGSDTPIS